MSPSLSERKSSPEFSQIFQFLGYGLFGLFAASLAKLLLPVALFQPAWYVQFASSLRSTAIFPLLGSVLLLLALLLRSQSRRLAAQLIWVRRLACFAAIGFLLLIPLQTQAGLMLIGSGNSDELRNLNQVKQVVEEIRFANSEAEMKLAISRLPGAPAEIQGPFSQPLNQVRTVMLDQLQPQIQRADNRLAELRQLRLRGGLLAWIGDGLVALALAACFAAIAQLEPNRPILLLAVLKLPQQIRQQLNRRQLKRFIPRRRARRSMDVVWFKSLAASAAPDQVAPGTAAPGLASTEAADGADGPASAGQDTVVPVRRD